MGSEGQRKKGHHKAVKRPSLGVNVLSLPDREDRDKEGRG